QSGRCRDRGGGIRCARRASGASSRPAQRSRLRRGDCRAGGGVADAAARGANPGPGQGLARHAAGAGRRADSPGAMRAVIVFAAALVVSALIFPAAIGQLARARMGQQIREEGPAAHHSKAGTPTAGGLFFVLLALVLYLAADRSLAGGFVLIALILGAALGFIDDVSAIRGRRSLGLKARQKIVIQLATGAFLGYLAVRWGLTSQWVPVDGRDAVPGRSV